MRITLIALPALLAFAGAAALPTPAAAKADDRCAAAPAEIRAAAAKADPASAGAALRHLAVGEQLCKAGNGRAAAKKFRAAAGELGLGQSEQLAAR